MRLNTLIAGFLSAIALQPANAQLTSGLPATTGSLDYVVCTSGASLNVRDQSLNRVLFTVSKYATTIPVQSFGTDRIEKVINGVTYTYINVQFPDRPSTSNRGWVADAYVRLRSECAGAPAPTVPQTPEIGEVVDDGANSGTALSSWTFPLLKRPSSSYKTGARKFMASRSGGTRLHAACDLYRVKDEAVVSSSAGKVIRSRYYFYEGTYALEVKHSDGKVVRYGEITGKAAPGTTANSLLKLGQTIGYVGKVNSGCCTPMLHFEMYAGTKTGSLTQSGNKFQRRSDLMDPTSYLATWEKAKFGTSY